MKRVMSVASSFYPDNSDEIVKYFEHFQNIIDQNSVILKKETTKAIISPHAGYIYSGFTAFVAYKSIKNTPKRFILIGPSHRVFIDGASVACFEEYETPFGDIEIDLDFSKELIKEYDFLKFEKNLHAEHSTETQAPFVKYFFPNSKVIEIVYGKTDFLKLSLLIDEFLKDDDNIVVISSDLSHFYDLEFAKKLDSICLEGIAKLDNSILDRGCEACGIVGIKAVIDSAKRLDLKSKLLDYRTSYDASGDDSRVVGYTSALFI